MPHDGPGEHYHDIGERIGALGDTVAWTTVGLDIGSSTAQAVFSTITLAREDAYYVVRDRTVLHQSEVILTPYASPELIDQALLASFIEREFCAAGLQRSDIDTGAVIMTGLALSTHNARAIADIVADDSGRFVAVSAGDLLEARLAANGAGLANLSATNPGIVLHVDIGGGTTKLSTWSEGRLLRSAAIDVGARLVTTDVNGRIVRLEGAMARRAATLGLDLRAGGSLSRAAADTLGADLAEQILSHGGLLGVADADRSLLRTAPLYASDPPPVIAAVVFSGGVSEYIYRREARVFGDLGEPLGRAVRTAVEASGVRMLESSQGIRATVLGASQHSVQLSGNTVYVSDAGCLPLLNLPVVLPSIDLSPEILDAATLARALADALRISTHSLSADRGFAIALQWRGSPTYQRLTLLADAIASAAEPMLGDKPCVVIVEGDVAGLLGALLDQRVAGRRHVICLDGVHVHEFDHVDIGELGSASQALPVVVKSLLFAETFRRPP